MPGFVEEQPDNKPDKRTLTITERSVLLYLSSHPEATQREVAEGLASGRTAVADRISSLQAEDYLCREGSRKKGTWVVIKLEKLGL